MAKFEAANRLLDAAVQRKKQRESVNGGVYSR
jgi:hypothetical protein